MILRWPSSLSPANWRRARTNRMEPVRNVPPAYDTQLILIAATLLLFGLVMVYSATIALPDSPRFAAYKPWHFAMRHLLSLVIGVGAIVVVCSIPIERWQKYAMPLFLIGLLLLIIVLVPGLGKSVYGARRWIPLGFMNLQPSELMKIFVILYASDYVVRKQAHIHTFRRGFLPLAVAIFVVGVALLLEPDLGALMVMACIGMGLLVIGGMNIGLFLGLSGILAMVFGLVIWLSPWRRERIFAYLAPFEEQNVMDKGYQLAQSLMAFGRGELTGVGLGGSIGKLHYLPEAHTDFLLAVIGEELGLVGVVVVLVLFFLLIRKAFEIGRQAAVVNSFFSGLVAMGVGLWLGIQAFMNIGVNLGLLPTKGLTLPFLSYGGSAILCNCIGLAFLLRIDFENKAQMRGKPR